MRSVEILDKERKDTLGFRQQKATNMKRERERVCERDRDREETE